MAQPKKYLDLFPLYRPAGLETLFKNESTANCLQKEEIQSPDDIKRYRKSYKEQAGTKILHYGVVNDPMPPDNHVYGQKSGESLYAGELFKDRNPGIKGLVNDIQERKYASRQKEPLGQSLNRNYQYPEQVNDENFQFGVATLKNEFTAKELILPVKESIKETQQTMDQYKKSHNMYEAGEQKNRNYNWYVNPVEHKFGVFEPLSQNQIKGLLQPQNSSNQFPQTNIVKKNLEDFRDFKNDQLGQPKNLGQVNQYIGDDHTYGVKTSDKGEWNVAMCIRGEATFKEAQPDTDLGKSIRFGYRNQPKYKDSDRIFGVPTIRTDIPKPAFKSVADQNNYGDEQKAIELLIPQKYVEMGLSKEDFECLREKQEIRDIFEAVGYCYKIGKFEAMYNRAIQIQQELSPTQQLGYVSVKAFTYAVKELDKID